MSYQVLARKWRPQNFTDLVGQEHVVKALINALETGRLHHAYLFTGTRGVGKTTIARIFAKSLNCENGVSAEPCGTCSICQDIMAGRFFDLIEVDAASNTGVDDTRELLENAQYKPTSGRYKVYLIDEVHMFSRSSFNALLKTLEEPPEHVKFLLATTEQQKLPATVLSRCLQFNLKSMPQALLAEHLANILKAESIDFEVDALAQVAKVADGSVRDSLSLVEQVAALGEGAVKSSVVENLLGVLSVGRVVELVRCIAHGEAEQSLSLIAGMSEFSPDYSQLLADMLSVLHHMAMQQMVPGAAASSDWPAESLAEILTSLSPEDVQLFYQIALQGQRDMPYAPLPRESFEMTVLRMLHFRQLVPADNAAADAKGSGSGGGTGSAISKAAASTEPQTPSEGQSATANATPIVETPINETPIIETPAKPLSEPAADSLRESAPLQQPPESLPASPVSGLQAKTRQIQPAQAQPAQAQPSQAQSAQAQPEDRQPRQIPTQHSPALQSVPPAAKNGSSEHLSNSAGSEPIVLATGVEAGVEDNSITAANRQDTANKDSTPCVIPQPVTWNDTVDRLPINGAAMQLARNCSLTKVEQQNGRQSIVLNLTEQHEELKVVLACQRLEESLAGMYQQSVQLVFQTGRHELETVAQRDERLAQEAQRAAEASIAADPIVQNILERVDGELEQFSIQPVVPGNR